MSISLGEEGKYVNVKKVEPWILKTFFTEDVLISKKIAEGYFVGVRSNWPFYLCSVSCVGKYAESICWLKLERKQITDFTGRHRAVSSYP